MIVGKVFDYDGTAYSFYTDPLPIEFIFGMVIARMAGNHDISISACLVMAGLALLAITAFFPIVRQSPERFLIWGIPAALIVSGSIFLETKSIRITNKTLQLLGDASYALYITNFLLIGPVIRAAGHLGIETKWPIVLISFLICIVAGVAFHFAIEMPLIGFCRQILMRGDRDRKVRIAG